MINKNELRTGNLVFDTFRNESAIIVEIRKYCAITNLGKSLYSEIEPVPVSEDWLCKVGFEPNGYGGYTKSWKPSMYNNYLITYRVGRGMNDLGFSIWDESIGGNPEIKNTIQYVHQLQNIWFFLTRNEELTIKETPWQQH